MKTVKRKFETKFVSLCVFFSLGTNNKKSNIQFSPKKQKKLWRKYAGVEEKSFFLFGKKNQTRNVLFFQSKTQIFNFENRKIFNLIFEFFVGNKQKK